MWSCSATACRIGTLMLAISAGLPPTDIVPLKSLLSHIRSLVMSRKYSPAKGSVSVAQRSNIRYDFTNSSFQMFSHSCTWLAAREAGRSMSNDDRIISGGTLPTLSTRLDIEIAAVGEILEQ